MRRSSKQFRSSASTEETEVIQYDDGGSGLFEACQTRFASCDCEITCDARHTVWVKSADGTRSVGMAPWLLGRHSLNELLDDVEDRLGLAAGAR